MQCPRSCEDALDGQLGAAPPIRETGTINFCPLIITCGVTPYDGGVTIGGDGQPSGQRSIEIVISTNSDKTPGEFLEILEHEMVHAQQRCNGTGANFSDCDRCLTREREAYQVQCGYQYPGDPEMQAQCAEAAASAQCEFTEGDDCTYPGPEDTLPLDPITGLPIDLDSPPLF